MRTISDVHKGKRTTPGYQSILILQKKNATCLLVSNLEKKNVETLMLRSASSLRPVAEYFTSDLRVSV